MHTPVAAAVHYRVREASSRDVEPLVELYRQEAEFHQQLARYYEVERDFDWTAFIQHKLTRSDRTIFVAEQQGELIGFIHVRIAGFPRPARTRSLLRRLGWWWRPPPGLPLKPLSWGVIEDCFVAEAFRRQGVGAALASQAMAWLEVKQVRRVELGVLSNNPAAQRFWEQLGFHTFRVSMHRDVPSPGPGHEQMVGEG